MHVPGDKYHVHYTVGGRTTTHPSGPWDSWQDAKFMRNASFTDFKDVQAAWVTKFNPSQNTRPNLYGNVLKRYIKKKCTAS